jgi:sterol 3beta-glucosyltransferase
VTELRVIRGDVQPFIALALGLEKSGHHVTIATHEAHREFVTDYNIKFFPLAGKSLNFNRPLTFIGDPKKLMKLCVDNGMFSISFMKEAYGSYMTFIDELMVTSWEATKGGTDVIVQNPPVCFILIFFLKIPRQCVVII